MHVLCMVTNHILLLPMQCALFSSLIITAYLSLTQLCPDFIPTSASTSSESTPTWTVPSVNPLVPALVVVGILLLLVLILAVLVIALYRRKRHQKNSTNNFPQK